MTLTIKNKRVRTNLTKLRGKLCERCKREQVSQLHHKDQNPENNEDSNVLLLCDNCHVFIHKEMRRTQGSLKTTGHPFYRKLEI